MITTDYEVTANLSAASQDELSKLLLSRGGKPVRLCGLGSAQKRLPPAPEPVALVSLSSMKRLVHFEPDDQTCSVEPGMPRAELDVLLAQKGLCLPCAGTGTIGGIFSTGEHGPLAPGAHSPRSLLLGLEGLLADGTPFQSGARVVKSVAGFDLHKLFVGSRGRLFVATLLHLKLRPLPRARLRFGEAHRDLDQALARFMQLRNSATAPKSLVLAREAGGFRVHGAFEGGSQLLARIQETFALSPAAAEPDLHVSAPTGLEVVSGLVRPSRAKHLAGLFPLTAPFLIDGGGRFEVALPADVSDSVLAALPGIEAQAEIRLGTRNRRGRATPLDPAALGLCHRIKKALDPQGMLL